MNKTPKYKISIIKRYDFESSLQRMSTVVLNSLDSTYRAYVKGSPEKVADLCIPETIPRFYFDILEEYTKKGYRVIALAYKVFNDSSYMEI